jgi:hypothetical protein
LDRELVEFDVPARSILLMTFAAVAGTAGERIEFRFDHRDIRAGAGIGADLDSTPVGPNQLGA